MDKVDLPMVLALAMYGLALVSVLMVHHSASKLITVRSMFNKFFYGVLICLSFVLTGGAVNTAARLSGFSQTSVIMLTLAAIFFAFMALVAVGDEEDLMGKRLWGAGVTAK